MRKFVSLLAAAALAAVSVAIPSSASAAIDTCSSVGICFYENPDNLPIAGFNAAESPVRQCRAVPANRTTYVRNNTTSQWRVFTGPNCTGTPGPIFARTSGPMRGVYYRSIDSVYRL